MKCLKVIILATAGVLALLILPIRPGVARTSADAGNVPQFAGEAAKSDYIVIALNDLGMHCISPGFSQMAILPPYNNLQAQVIRRGSPPRIVTSGVTLRYSIKKNTTVVGKTDFWQYAQPLFGVDLPVGIGLTGNGLSGTMVRVGNHYEARGIPTVPRDDQGRWYPYQKGVVRVFDSGGTLLTRTVATIPVSDELRCDRCHDAGGVGSPGFDTGTVDGNILAVHDARHETSLTESQPVLCASCHADNALGTPGNPGVPSLSLAMHGRHSRLGADVPSCYDCHPGSQTQCLRTKLEGMGPNGSEPNCERCHGSIANVAATIRDGRQPWLDEPTCAQCHGASYATNQPLYRNSTGHHGVQCAACHNSPHAWYPSSLAVDNKQSLRLQESTGPIGENDKCVVCHTSEPDDDEGGIHESDGDDDDDEDDDDDR